MSQLVIDLISQLKDLKARENLLAYGGLNLTVSGDGHATEGVLKVAGTIRPDRSGYLTLTFIMDICRDRAACDRVGALLGVVNTADFSRQLGPDFEYLIPFEPFAAEQAGPDGPEWFMGDMTFYFKNLAGRERQLTEQRLLPALTRALPVRFQPLEWWEG